MPQANKIQIHELVIGQLSALYRPPIDPDRDPKGYGVIVDSMVEDIYSRGYTEEALQAGMTCLRFQHKYQRWPVIAELLEFLDEGRANHSRPFIPKLDAPSWRRVQDQMGIHGPEAARRGVAFDLSVWLENNPGEEVTPAVIDDLVATTERIRARMLEVADNPKMLGPYTDALLSLWKAVELRNHRAAERILG